jgi:hypothetical protein
VTFLRHRINCVDGEARQGESAEAQENSEVSDGHGLQGASEMFDFVHVLNSRLDLELKFARDIVLSLEAVARQLVLALYLISLFYRPLDAFLTVHKRFCFGP